MDELNRLSVDDFKQANKLPIVIILDNVRSLYNVGSVFRTCDAFLVSGICLCGITGTPPHKELHKTALGATESVEWKYYKTTMEAIDELKSEGWQIAVVEQTTESIFLQDFMPAGKIAYIFGNEVEGVDEQVIAQADVKVEIPQFGTKHSFNISVTAAIILWETAQKMKAI
jgi:tRNA G18 (ribose-2'-O)-methylase SpoU